MLDIKKIRENPEYYIAETKKKYTTVASAASSKNGNPPKTVSAAKPLKKQDLR